VCACGEVYSREYQYTTGYGQPAISLCGDVTVKRVFDSHTSPNSYSVHSTARKVSNRDGFPDHRNSDARTHSSRFGWLRDISRLLRFYHQIHRIEYRRSKPNFWLSAPAKQTHEDMASTTCDGRKCSSLSGDTHWLRL
jgi:transcription initiation factor TFIIIB Brf1 subunit/transcription initiation factor TFIIB